MAGGSVESMSGEMAMRIVLLGNAGSGKTTMARRLADDRDIPQLSLDDIAWRTEGERKPLEESLRELESFIAANTEWIIEGCYADLVEAALPYCSELRFLNPGIPVCVAHCRNRPWEPDKFTSADAQDAMLEALIAWVQEYETREDEFGLRRHREVFDGFAGWKMEYRGPSPLRPPQVRTGRG